MVKNFDLLFVGENQPISSIYLEEDLRAVDSGGASYNGEKGSLFMLPDKEAFFVLDVNLGMIRERIKVKTKDGKFESVWRYL